MEQVYIWVKDVFLVIISLSFFQILIPDSKMEKYLKFIFSIIIGSFPKSLTVCNNSGSFVSPFIR